LRGSVDMSSDMSPRAIKLERSVSRTPQRTMTDSSLTMQAHNGFMHARSNTLPRQISIPPHLSQALSNGGIAHGFHADDAQAALWHHTRSLQESPTSMTNSSPGLEQPQDPFPPQNYQLQNVNPASPASCQFAQQPDLDFANPGLQAVHDILLDEPQQQQYSNINQSQQHMYTSMPQSAPPCQYDAMSQVRMQQPRYQESLQTYHVSLPPTPTPTQQMQYSVDPPYQEPRLLAQMSPVGQYFLPQKGFYPMDWDLLKEIKDGDPLYGPLPNQAIPNYTM